MSVRPLVLGLDPDVDRPGVALYDAQAGALVFVGKMGLRELVGWVRQACPVMNLPVPMEVRPSGVVLLACVEDTRHLPLYARHRNAAKSPADRDKRARDIGRLDEVTRLLLDELAEVGIGARSCAPVRKLDAETFTRVTGWRGTTNEEGRDAGMLCFGVQPERVRLRPEVAP